MSGKQSAIYPATLEDDLEQFKACVGDTPTKQALNLAILFSATTIVTHFKDTLKTELTKPPKAMDYRFVFGAIRFAVMSANLEFLEVFDKLMSLSLFKESVFADKHTISHWAFMTYQPAYQKAIKARFADTPASEARAFGKLEASGNSKDTEAKTDELSPG